MITRIRNGRGQPWRHPSGGNAPLARRAAESIWDRSKSVIKQHPQGSLIASLTAGAVFGWIIKRL